MVFYTGNNERNFDECFCILFTPYSRVSRSFGDVTIANEGYKKHSDEGVKHCRIIK